MQALIYSLCWLLDTAEPIYGIKCIKVSAGPGKGRRWNLGSWLHFPRHLRFDRKARRRVRDGFRVFRPTLAPLSLLLPGIYPHLLLFPFFLLFLSLIHI